MRYAVLSYDASSNIGDEIQSIAAARLLPRVDSGISREKLRDFRSDEKHLLVMNGYFNKGASFPPAEDIVPLYISFHISKSSQARYTTPECIAHFHKHSPIGCRDRGTVEILRRAGVDAFYSKCLSLTLPKRESSDIRGGAALSLLMLPPQNGLMKAESADSSGIKVCRRESADMDTVTTLSGIRQKRRWRNLCWPSIKRRSWWSLPVCIARCRAWRWAFRFCISANENIGRRFSPTLELRCIRRWRGPCVCLGDDGGKRGVFADLIGLAKRPMLNLKKRQSFPRSTKNWRRFYECVRYGDANLRRALLTATPPA